MPKVTIESDERDVFLKGFIGTNRTGKTTIATEEVIKWKEINDGPVMCFDPQHRFRNLASPGMIIDPSDKYFPDKILRLRNALLVLDDYRLLHPSSRTEPWLSKLMYFRAEYSIDIIYICHNPALVLEDLTYYTSEYYVFMTNSRDGKWRDKIPNYYQCMVASKVINQYTQVNGKGKYPDFPHVVVDNMKGEIFAMNMKADKLPTNK